MPMPRQRRRYYDDNAWIGLVLRQLHLQTGDAGGSSAPGSVFRFVARGAGSRRRRAVGRGAACSRNTCSTAPAAQLALRLALPTATATTLAFAERTLAWLDATLRLPRWAVRRPRRPARRGSTTLWTYNQGAPRRRARAAAPSRPATTPRSGERWRTARAALRRFDGDRTWRHPPVFNAVWFRNLLALDAIGRARPRACMPALDALPRPRLAHGARSRRPACSPLAASAPTTARPRSTRPGWCSCSRCVHGRPTGCRTCADGPNG